MAFIGLFFTLFFTTKVIVGVVHNQDAQGQRNAALSSRGYGPQRQTAASPEENHRP